VTLLQSAMKTPLLTNQIEISLTAHAPFTNGDIAFHQERGQPLMAWSPLAGGSLLSGAQSPLRDALHRLGAAQGVDWSAIAVAWLLRHPAQIIPVMGTNSLDRIKALSDALRVEMDRPTWFALYTHALGHEVP
jgi:predicted oxidoreductase